MDQIIAYKGLVALIFLSGFLVLERLYPLSPRPRGESRVVSNFALAGGNALLSFSLIVPITLTAANFGPEWRSESFTGLWWILLDLLLLDLWIYAWHRANHVISFLWRFHEVHHLDEFLDASSAVRFHFGEVILSALIRTVPIILLDIQIEAVLIFDSLVLISAVFHHSNARVSPRFEKILRWVIVTPSHHWIHHHKVRVDTDSNYGTILTVWDRLFRSWSPNERTADMPIGTEGRQEKPLVSLLLSPFQKQG